MSAKKKMPPAKKMPSEANTYGVWDRAVAHPAMPTKKAKASQEREDRRLYLRYRNDPERQEVAPVLVRLAREGQTPAKKKTPASPRPTRRAVNTLLAGSYTADGIRRWWQRPRPQLGGRTPHAAWATEPERVLELARALAGGLGT